jgi:hypothetical protein
MSLPQGHGLPSSGEEMQGYYQTLGPEWTGVDTVCQVTDTDTDTDSAPGPNPGVGAIVAHTETHSLIKDIFSLRFKPLLWM